MKTTVRTKASKINERKNDILDEYEEKPKRKIDTKERIIILLIILQLLSLIVIFFDPKPKEPNINQYDLVEFNTTENGNPVYIEVEKSNDDVDYYDKYLKFITVDDNKIMKKNRVGISYNEIKFKIIQKNEKPHTEVETIVTDKGGILTDIQIEYIYTLYLPKEDIEKLKKEM